MFACVCLSVGLQTLPKLLIVDISNLVGIKVEVVAVDLAAMFLRKIILIQSNTDSPYLYRERP